jgi:hypothetical protein
VPEDRTERVDQREGETWFPWSGAHDHAASVSGRTRQTFRTYGLTNTYATIQE